MGGAGCRGRDRDNLADDAVPVSHHSTICSGFAIQERNLPSQQDKEYVGAPPAPTHPMKLSIATRKSPATLPALAALRSSSGGCGRNGGRDAGCHSNVMVEIVKSGSSEGREAL